MAPSSDLIGQADYSTAPRPSQVSSSPRRRGSSSSRTTVASNPTIANSSTNGGGDFEFIVGTTPGELKSKQQMTKVRKKAMQHFLQLQSDDKGTRRSHKAAARARMYQEEQRFQDKRERRDENLVASSKDIMADSHLKGTSVDTFTYTSVSMHLDNKQPTI